jgi:hypothetical protein
LDEKYADSKNYVTFDDTIKTQISFLSQTDKTLYLKKRIEDEIKKKKV